MHKSIIENENSLKQQIIENQEKDKLLYEQAKLVSMGEMIGNIAHQWRQPLSVISTAATGMLLSKEHGILRDDFFEESCKSINQNAQYLSQTIDDFKNFIKGDRTKKVFNLNDNINSFLALVTGTIKDYNINIILNLEEDINIDGYENELTQCLINIFNNAKDALKEKNIENKHIFISTNTMNNKVIISIKDNAGGIPKDILPKIFEPYFTTKHKSKGTGLGLHMTYKLIVEGTNGTIEVDNIEFEYNNKEYAGVEFRIILPHNK
jgi:signal transduction histidine kinase